MKNMRRHTRYNLNSIDVKGKMSLSNKVEILDVSLGGVAFKTDRRLNPGKDYSIEMLHKGKTLNITGNIARLELIGMEARENEKSVAIYAAGMEFKDGSADQVTAFLESIVQNQKETGSVPKERRVNVRFQITDPNEKILCYPGHFRVKTISLSGMLIQTDQTLEVESKVPMVLSLNDGPTVNFIGRIVSCEMREDKGQTHYEIGTEFIALTTKDITLLQTFIDQWAAMGNGVVEKVNNQRVVPNDPSNTAPI